jgi:hypothetical protein
MSDDAPSWFREAQRGGFDVGDRVRVRLHGEYPVMTLKSGSQIAAHQPAEDGRSGTINERIEDETACVYCVWFDEPFSPFPGFETTIDNWLYTAAELEPLT